MQATVTRAPKLLSTQTNSAPTRMIYINLTGHFSVTMAELEKIKITGLGSTSILDTNPGEHILKRDTEIYNKETKKCPCLPSVISRAFHMRD